jgi:hypothetical protein
MMATVAQNDVVAAWLPLIGYSLSCQPGLNELGGQLRITVQDGGKTTQPVQRLLASRQAGTTQCCQLDKFMTIAIGAHSS